MHLAALLLALVHAAHALAPFSLPAIHVSGCDDQGIPSALLDSTRPSDHDLLASRFAVLKERVQPGNRRYNMFWTAFEPSPSSSTVRVCPPGHVATPSSEADRVARGYHHFHCYSNATLSSYDTIFALDASIGSVSTGIVYGAPDWAVNASCTGFPWPPNANFRMGCIPWTRMDDWEDYMLLLVERYHAPLNSGRARLSGLVIWNEIQSMGWADPSPVLPNRYTGVPWTRAQLDVYTDAIAQLFERAARASARHMGDMMLWLSTDHFTLAPPLKVGDVMHLGLYEFLQSFWPRIDSSTFAEFHWGVAVHPYDGGDPRLNLTARGIYTFATLAADVADKQCEYLVARGVARADCGAYAQTQMWASEQGWPISSTMNRTLQARNICFAHGLSVQQGLWSVTHNTFQGNTSSSQGGSGDFNLLDEPPLCNLGLSNCDGRETFEAYVSLPPSVWNVSSAHYCCTRWGWGCAA